MAAALAHYAALGFSTFGYEGGGDYGFANRDGVSLHLALDPDHDPGTTYLSVRDADALYEEWSKPGIGGVTRPVGLMEYGLPVGDPRRSTATRPTVRARRPCDPVPAVDQWACGMQRSSYSAMMISPASGPQAGQAGSRRTLKVRNDSSSAS